MNILGIDFETTTNDVTQAKITEIGAVMFDENWVEQISSECFVYDESYPPQSEEVIRITGITDEMLKREGEPPRQALLKLLELMKPAAFFVAHNKEFDRQVFEKAMQEYLPDTGIPVKGKWLCSYQDIQYPLHFKCKKLSHLALDHGITVRPETLHRATGDIRLMAELMRHGGYKLQDMIDYAGTPWVLIRADVSFGNNQLAKDRQYRWNPTFKRWEKKVKKNVLEEVIHESPFRVIILEEEKNA